MYSFLISPNVSDANSTLWIFKEQPIDQEILINNKTASLKAALVLKISYLNYWSWFNMIGGGDRTRTRYLLLAKQPLSQLSYTPNRFRCGMNWWVWLVSNQRPLRYQHSALTNWATDPSRSLFELKSFNSVRWRLFPTTDKCGRLN
jgi:hypothetical protein